MQPEWTKLDNVDVSVSSRRTPAESKKKVMQDIDQILRNMGITWDDLLGRSRYAPITEARIRVSVVVRESIWADGGMSWPDISRLTGMSWTTMFAAKERWKAKYEEQSPGPRLSTQFIEPSAAES